MLTNEQIAEIERRAGAAAPGPWVVRNCTHLYAECKMVKSADDISRYKRVCKVYSPSENTAEFIANSRTDIPALIAALRAVTEQRDRLRTTLAELLANKIHDPNRNGYSEGKFATINTRAEIVDRARAAIAACQETPTNQNQQSTSTPS